MKKLIFLLLCFWLGFTNAQEASKEIPSGVILMRNNESVNFKNLYWKNGKAFFTNTDNNQNEELYDNSIIKITDSNNITVFESKDSETVKNSPPQTFQTEIILEKKEYKNSLGYPEGIYATKENFINKIPSSTETISKRRIIGYGKEPAIDEEVNAFFYNSQDNKIKSVFAIVYHGDLYFGVSAILNNRNKTDRAQGANNPNSFVKIMFGGNNYIYSEVNLANIWAQGAAYNMGAAGSSLANSLNVGKGIVWDFKNQEFNIFKNCQDYNQFIGDKYPDAVQKCENQQPNMNEVRAAMLIIK